MSEKVVITGWGACTASARDAAELWQQVKEKKAGPPQAVSSEGGSVQALRYARSAAVEALSAARLLSGTGTLNAVSQRVGVTVSASKPFFEADGRVSSPDGVNDALARFFGAEGERRNIIAACATGAYATALGASWIEQGLCDVVVAGSVEPSAHPLIEAGFARMGVMSREPAMRPFDLHRSGFVLGSGAGVVVLESEAHARERGARPRARLTGWGWGADGHSAVAFNSNGERIAQVIRQTLRRAGINPEAVGHVNAHGTATELNDWIETQALLKAFGPHAENLMISATKSSTGHLLGAAGSVELVLALKALEEQFVPPTAHLETADPSCPLDYTPRQGHPANFSHALSLSFGFGGPIGALLVSQNE